MTAPASISAAPRKHWYVVYAKPHREEQAEQHLKLKGLEVFFPKLLIPEAEGRKRLVALFPGYFFVRIDLRRHYADVIWTPGVRRMVAFNDVPAPIDDRVVAFLKERALPGDVLEARSRLRAGEEVLIQGGPFDGLAGVIQEPPDARGRVKVLLKLLSRPVRVELKTHFIRNGSAAYQPAYLAEAGRQIGAAAPSP